MKNKIEKVLSVEYVDGKLVCFVDEELYHRALDEHGEGFMRFQNQLITYNVANSLRLAEKMDGVGKNGKA